MNASNVPDVSRIVARTRQLESQNGTKGLAVTCKAKGLSNDYGFNVPNCYKPGEDTKLVEKWFAEKLKGMSLAEANCLYTGYGHTENCPRNNYF